MFSLLDYGRCWFYRKWVKLFTNAFTKNELNLLVEALDKNFSIKATIHKSSIEKQQVGSGGAARLLSLYFSQKKQLPLVRYLI